MGRSYSQDIRGRVILAVAEGLSRRAAAPRFAVSENSADPLGGPDFERGPPYGALAGGGLWAKGRGPIILNF
jgi:hypothetical protein